MLPVSRRQFLKGSALLAASAAIGPDLILDTPADAHVPQGAGNDSISRSSASTSAAARISPRSPIDSIAG